VTTFTATHNDEGWTVLKDGEPIAGPFHYRESAEGLIENWLTGQHPAVSAVLLTEQERRTVGRAVEVMSEMMLALDNNPRQAETLLELARKIMPEGADV
jgi:hypothetical protein